MRVLYLRSSRCNDLGCTQCVLTLEARADLHCCSLLTLSIDTILELKPEIILMGTISDANFSAYLAVMNRISAEYEAAVKPPYFSVFERTVSLPTKLSCVIEGCTGYVLCDTGADSLIKAMQSVLRGEVWIERGVNNVLVRSMISSSIIKGRITRLLCPAPDHGDTGLISKAKLSKRESQIAALVLRGLANKTIAAQLVMSENTVKCHLYRLFRKIKVGSRIQMIRALQGSEFAEGEN